jgi:hypothetical protein
VPSDRARFVHFYGLVVRAQNARDVADRLRARAAFPNVELPGTLGGEHVERQRRELVPGVGHAEDEQQDGHRAHPAAGGTGHPT